MFWMLIYSGFVLCPHLIIVTFFRSNKNSSPHADGNPNEGERKRIRLPYQSKTYKVDISYAARISLMYAWKVALALACGNMVVMRQNSKHHYVNESRQVELLSVHERHIGVQYVSQG